MKPTMELRWKEKVVEFDLEGVFARRELVLQQLWVSDLEGEFDEWRDIEVEE